MKFKNDGLIFEVSNRKELRSYQFAQSPQPIILDDRIRVYFSTRCRTKIGELPISEVRYVDFDFDFENIYGVSENKVIQNGNLGTFDEHGIFPFHPYFANDRLFGFTSGWSRRISVSIETAIGLTESMDKGASFSRIGNGPIIGPTLDEPFLVGDPYIIKSMGKWFMFYIAGKEWKFYNEEIEPQRVYKIRGASSEDLYNWEKMNIDLIPNILGPDECQALPTVFPNGKKYSMIYCYREAYDFRNNSKNSYRLGHAKSSNLIDWKLKSIEIINPNNHNWDSEMKCYPSYITTNGNEYLLYNGNEFGKKGFGIAKRID